MAGNVVYAADSVSIMNVSYDPTRELYEQYNKIFQEHWKEETGQDVDAIQNAKLIEDGWVDEFPDDSSSYTFTIVFLVRKGNPKNIKDWDDLVTIDDFGGWKEAQETHFSDGGVFNQIYEG